MRKMIIGLTTLFVMADVLFWTGLSLAHSPHDVIFDIAVSPDYSHDKTVFIITSNTLMVSTNGGFHYTKVANGLDHKSQLTSIAISPAFHEDGIVLATSEHDGIYRTEDSGRSWTRVNVAGANLNVKSVGFSPGFMEDHTALLLDEGGHLFISMDSARTWEPFGHDIPETLTQLVWLDGEEDLHLAFGTDGGSIVIMSDFGRRLEKIDGPDGCGAITAMAVSPHFKTDGKIWAGSEACGVFEVDVSKKNIRKLGQGLDDSHITSILPVMHSDGQIAVYASTWRQALFELSVSGGVWEQKGHGLTTDPQADDPYFRLPHFKGIAAADGRLFLGGYDGLFMSLNGGDSWEQIDTIMLNGITGLDVYTDTAGRNHQVGIATYGAGAYLFDYRQDRWTILNRGLTWTRLNDFVFSRNYTEDGIIFSGSENDFLWFDTADDTWRRVPVTRSLKRRLTGRIDRYLKKIGVSSKWRYKLFPPLPGDRRFPTNVAPSPGIAVDQTLYFGTRNSGVYISDDAGHSNRMLWGADGKLVTSLCLSPNFEEDGIIFAGIYGTGIFRSEDNGESWEKSSVPSTITGEVIIGVSPNFSMDQTLIAGHSSGLLCSMDAARSWHAIGLKDLGPTPNVVCLAVSPDYKEDGTLLVGIKGHGLWVTRDRGENFSPFAKTLIDSNHQAKFVQFSDKYREDGAIYVAASYALFRSLDQGNSWNRMLPPTRYENFREEIRYAGEWRKVESDDYSALSAAYTNTPGSRLKLRFDGAGFSWIGDKSPLHGEAKITVDDLPSEIISQKSVETQKSVEVFSMSSLDERHHELVIEIFCPSENERCGSISIDAIDIEPHG